MKTRYRDMTEKYKTLRLQPDSLYSSRTIATLFNKFTKKGEKARARRHIRAALQEFRFTHRRPQTFNRLTGRLQDLRVQFLLVSKRKGSKIIDVPVPVRRNQRAVLNIHTVYNAVRKRDERKVSERFGQELLALVVNRNQSSTLRTRNIQISAVHDERANREAR